MKKEWLEEYKKLSSTQKLEEKNLVLSCNEDFHLNKILNNLIKEDCDLERKNLEDVRKRLKGHINEIYEIFKGNLFKKNSDLRQKIYKIEDEISSNRIELKNKFENLLLEEENIEKELIDFEMGLRCHETENSISYLQTKNEYSENHSQDNIASHLSNKKYKKLEEYIFHITNKNTPFSLYEKFSTEEISKTIELYTINDLEEMKSKTSLIEKIIEKDLGGINLSWSLRDHQEFLKLKTLHNNKIETYDFLNELENCLPFIPRSELKNHIKLYTRFHQLNEIKKLIISKYKELKQSQESKSKKEILNNLTQKNNYIYEDKSKIQENKQKLEEWKRKKAQEKREKFEEEIKMENEKKEKEREKYLEKKEKTRSMIEEYKKNKEFLTEMKKDCSIKDLSNKDISAIDLKRIDERNEKLVEKKTLLVKSKSINSIRTSENYTKYKLKKWVKMESMQPKLTEVTENYENKKRNKHQLGIDKPRQASTMANNVLNRMSRAIPEWRRSLL